MGSEYVSPCVFIQHSPSAALLRPDYSFLELGEVTRSTPLRVHSALPMPATPTLSVNNNMTPFKRTMLGLLEALVRISSTNSDIEDIMGYVFQSVPSFPGVLVIRNTDTGPVDREYKTLFGDLNTAKGFVDTIVSGMPLNVSSTLLGNSFDLEHITKKTPVIDKKTTGSGIYLHCYQMPKGEPDLLR